MVIQRLSDVNYRIKRGAKTQDKVVHYNRIKKYNPLVDKEWKDKLLSGIKMDECDADETVLYEWPKEIDITEKSQNCENVSIANQSTCADWEIGGSTDGEPEDPIKGSDSLSTRASAHDPPDAGRVGDDRGEPGPGETLGAVGVNKTALSHHKAGGWLKQHPDDANDDVNRVETIGKGRSGEGHPIRELENSRENSELPILGDSDSQLSAGQQRAMDRTRRAPKMPERYGIVPGYYYE